MDEKRRLLLRLIEKVKGFAPLQDVAVIGVAGRYPMAETLQEFWAALRAGSHCIQEVPPDRWDLHRHYDPTSNDGRMSYSKWAGFLRDVDKFDPLFFEISPADAEAMDPQERLFLETAWATIEHAGYAPKSLARQNPVGVFVGIMNSNYEWMGGEANALGVDTDAHSNRWSVANRVSYTLDFRGPSIAVDTACSASLTAIHLACESLRRQECQLAIAGGVNLILHPMHLRMLSSRGMISRDDRCKSFGKGADGFVDGEGVGAVLLKPLDRAIADGDCIHGVIKGSAVNSGGKTGGYTVPSPVAQAEVVKSALLRARIDPRTISYVEAHGTGTALGDPIEVAGLQEAFRLQIDPALEEAQGRCAIGSVKSNIGHLESAAGIAGLTKVLMQFDSAMVAPTLHAAELNPKIDLTGSPFFIQQALSEWRRPVLAMKSGERIEYPRRAGISSFGGGGANAHLIIEEYRPDAAASRPIGDGGRELIVLSAKSEERLKVYAATMAAFVDFKSMGENAAASDAAAAPELAAIESACKRIAAAILGIDPADIDVSEDLAEYGFGAAERALLGNRLSDMFGKDIRFDAIASCSLRDFARSLHNDAPGKAGKSAPSLALCDLAYTLQTGREAMEARLAFVANSLDAVRCTLRSFAEGRPTTGIARHVSDAAPPRQQDTPDARLDRPETADLEMIAERWVRGTDVDWLRLPRSGDARRIGLPTYPFARKRYWIPAPAAAATVVPSGPTAARTAADPRAAVGYYRPVWIAAGFEDAGTLAATAPVSPLRILILAPGDAAWLVDGITRHHHRDDAHIVRLEQPDCFAQLERIGRIDLIYHLGGVCAMEASLDAAALARAQRHGVLALLHLFRGLQQAGLASRPARLKVITNDARGAFGEAPRNPFAAGLHGLAQVAPKEFPQLKIACIDFAQVEAVTPAGRERVLAGVLAESYDLGGRAVLLRHGQRYVQQLRSVILPPPESAPFRDRGVYLIVGGSGGVGRLLSLHLAERYHAKIVWISRSDPGREQHAAIEQSRAAGGDIFHIKTDVCRLADMQRAIAETKARFGAIHGAIHAAMAFENGSVAAMDEARFEAALAAKVEGSVAFDQALAGEPLDFMVFFSSVASFASSAGNSAYVAASTFQDAYALSLQGRRHYPIKVVNWGYWGAVGSGARPGLKEIFDGLGIEQFSADEAFAALSLILGNRPHQVMPIRADDAVLMTMGLDPSLAERVLPGSAAATLREVAPRLVGTRPWDAGTEAVLAGYERLEALCQQALLGVFQRTGVFLRSGERHRMSDLTRRLGVSEKFTRLHAALLRILVGAGYLMQQGEWVYSLASIDEVARQANSDRLDAAFAPLSHDHPEIETTLTLARLLLDRYPQILRGEINATEVMFPDASLKLVQNFYKGNPLTDSFNALVGEAVRMYLERHVASASRGGPLRIVELGAGTGATTETVLPHLVPHADRVRYVFTDISQRFIDHGIDRFQRAYPFTDFSICDVERIDESGLTAGAFDVVLAANVLHATRDLRGTLRAVKALLKPGGWLVLNELTATRPLVTIIGGALDGWWLFEDDALRIPDSPLVNSSVWERLLREEGFGEVAVLDRHDTHGRNAGQNVIVGESDGVVERAAAAPAGAPAPIAIAMQTASDADTVAGSGSTGEAAEIGLLGDLQAAIQRALKLEALPDPDRPLFEYGFDSLNGMKVVAEIARVFGVKVSLGDWFQHPTLRETTRHFLGRGVLAPITTAVTYGVERSTVSASASPPVTPATTPPSSPLAFPLSEMQRGLWIVEQIAPGNYAYNLPLAFWVDPAVDVAALRRALQDLLDRHQSLRLRIGVERTAPVQIDAGACELAFEQHEFNLTDEEAVRDRVRAEARRPFNLQRGPLMRAALFKLADDRKILLLTFHHIVFDGISSALFLRELTQTYAALTAQQQPARPVAAADYADFVAWQNNLLTGPEGARLRSYWLDQLSGDVPPMRLPLDRPRPAVPSFHGSSLDGTIDRSVVLAAKALAGAERASLYSVLLSVFFSLLHRYTGQQRIRIGTPISNRSSSRFGEVIGLFMNMVVIQQDVRHDDGFRALLARVHKTVLGALDHGDYPLTAVVEAMKSIDRKNPSQLFQAAFYFQNWIEPNDGSGLLRGVFEGVHQEGEFDLTMEVVEDIGDCRFTVKYNPDLFDPETMIRLREHFVQLLGATVEKPDRPIGLIPLVSAERRRHLHVPRDRHRSESRVRPMADTAASHGVGPTTTPERPASLDGYDVLRHRLAEDFAQLLADSTGMEPQAVPHTTPFGEVGLDSMGFTKLTLEINERYGVEVYPIVFYQHPTFDELISYLLDAHGAALQLHFHEATAAPTSRAESRGAGTAAGGRRNAAAIEHADAAIIGMAGRLPQSPDLDTFWQHLVAGRDLIEEVPSGRWDWRQYAGAAGSGEKSSSRWGGFIADVDRFDAAFFGISPHEAELMDPQQRLLLEVVWAAIEDAGCKASDLAGRRVGVFIGVTNSDYLEVQRQAGRGLEAHTLPGAALSIIPNRVSYMFDFRGPSIAIDTACSGSLTAVYQGVAALRDGSCDLAIVGGVNLILRPTLHVALSKSEMLSEDGRCMTFDRRANGYARGEGLGVVVLKSRAAAERDGDPIHAFIKETAVNHGGRATSLLSPNPRAHADLLVEAYRRCRVDPGTVGYIETHGTGTALGDPIEIAGLKEAFLRLYRDAGRTAERPSCGLGSVKTNIGHLEAAAGIAGLFKTVLAMRHRMLPASLHFEQQNPQINLNASPFYVVSSPRAWEAPHSETGRPQPRRAGISSFGFGGANAHVIVEEAPAPVSCRCDDLATGLFVLSGHTKAALTEQVERLAVLLRSVALNGLTPSLADVAFTLQVGREAMNERLAVIASDKDTLLQILDGYLSGTAERSSRLFQGSVARGSPIRPRPATRWTAHELVRTLALERNLDRLAQLWVAGEDVDWRSLYGTNVPRRISLPTYPFARARHWVAPADPPLEPLQGARPDQAAPATSSQWTDREPSDHDRSPMPVMAFEPIWREAPQAAGRKLSGTLVVLHADARSADSLRHALAREAPALRLVMAPLETADFETTAANLVHAHASPFHVVHLAPAVGANAKDVAAAVDGGFHAALRFCRAWMKERGGELQYLYAYADDGGELAPHAAMAGFAYSLRWENPQLRMRLLRHPASGSGELARILLAELSTAYDGADVWIEAGTGGRRRLTRTWQKVELPAAPVPPLFGAAGAHIVTGGTGRLGLFVAERMQRRGAATIILVGRSAPSPEAHERIERLRAAGVDVICERADIARRSDVEQLVSKAKDRCGQIAGVVHAAGLRRDSFVLRKTSAEAEAVLGPKVYGTLWLDAATRREPLVYFVTFSSAAAVFGNGGQADYAFANSFTDHFIERREQLRARGQRRGRSLVIDWPLWAEGAMRIDAAAQEWMSRELGMRPMPADAALDGLERAMAAKAPRLLLAVGDENKMRRALDLGPPLPIAPVTSSAALAQPADIKERVEGFLLQILSRELKMPVEAISTTTPFDDYGIDSLLAGSITRAMETSLGVLPKTLFFEYLTVEQLAGYLLTHHAARLAQVAAGRGTDASAGMVADPPHRRAARARGVQPVEPATRAHHLIAIIGVAGRYPQADDLREFWRNLREGRNCIEEIPKQRWDHNQFYDPNPDAFGKSYSKWGGFLRDIDKFDPMFFRMSRREAELIDPQERIFLGTVWHLLEDAGYTQASLADARMGVFVGTIEGQYHLLGIDDALRGGSLAPSSSNASVANRVSHVFNFRGPSIAVDTMCSSSLVAVHLACSAIRNGDCDMAIAGGVSVCSHPIKYLQLCERRFLSADGRCRSFGEGGTGYVPGEGSGAILLKPLAAAIADSDRILAVIGGSAVNHGGAGKNYTAPNPKSQANLIREVLDRAGVDPDDVNYIEAHGTGTALGDPIEIEGLSRVYGGRDPSAPRCPVGSVKSNIGHAEAAAGIAGVTKVLLQMQHGMLVPSLHAERLNPNIDFAATPFYVQRDLAEWRPPAAGNGSAPRTAAVSSFGAGGTNAHIILQEYARDAVTHRAAPPPYLFVLSARSHSRLRDYAARWAAFLREEGADVGLPGMAYTLQIGREAMAHRLSILFTRRDELLEKLDHWRAGGADPAGVWSGSVQSRSAASREPDEQAVESLDRLAERWVQGGSVNWARLYDDAPPRRVSLPGYPFERERCWLPKASEGATSTTVSSLADADRAAAGLAVPSPAVAPASTLRSLQLLSKEWEDRPVRPAADSTGRAVAILATAATCDLAGRLAARLPDSEVVKPADLPARLRSFEAGTRSIGGVIDLAGCGDRRQPDGDDQSTDWLRWLQRLIGGGRRDLRMLFVSKGLERFGGNEVNLSGAARVGLYRMLQSEYGHVRSCHLDLDPQTSDDEMVGLIAAELGNCSDVEVCYRGGTRYRSVLRNAPCVGAPPRWTFPADQALWITGGTRGLGLRCARHFVAQHGVRRLVLTGKQELPSREQWNRYRFDEGPLGRKLRALQELIDQNVHLEVLSVPLIDEAGLAEALLESKRTMGRPFGVIHCAGSLDPENLAFIRKPVDRMEAVLAPKVAGLDRLIACFRDEQLRFFLLFSSVAAAVPALATGLSDYALANAYMDYVAEARVHGLPLVSLQWPSWKQGGMGEVRSAAYRRSGLGTLSDAEGLALLDRVLDGSAGRVVMPVVMEDPAAWDPAHLTSRTFAAPASAAEPAAASQHDTMPHARRQRADDAAHSAETEQAAISWMLDVLAAELHFDRDRLSAAIPLQDYGADSVMLTHLLQIAAKRLDVRLDPSAFLEYPTVQALISWLADEHAIAFSRAFADSVASSGSHPAVRCADRPRPEPSVEQAARDRQHAAPEPTGTPLDIAVVGMSCRFPESATLDQYWQLLSEGRSALGVIPPERWGYASAFRAGLIEGYGKFDPGFFLIRDEDAAAMDPQALLLLEETLSLFCHAGYRPEEFKGKTIGVYIGGRAQHFPAPDLLLRTHNPIVAVGQNYLAANISQFFDLRGPSVVVDTACSSALVAMNMAILALKAGDIDAAVVGGVSLLNSDSAHRVLQQRGILSTAPEFHVFDNRAHGVIPAEGVGLVLLKPLARALSEGDRVYALIKALAINNSGRTAGPAAPNPSALRSVMNNALMASGRDAASIAYVEANGSGSTVTDLIELKALKAIYRASTQAPCGLGSIKPNIGHPMCAEGIATFIKVVLMLYHRQQVPFLSGQEPLEHFDLAASPFQLQRRLTDWSDPPLVAAINCFGDGGTNAHAIVEALEADGAGVTRRPLTLPKLNRRPVTAKSGAAAPPDAGAPDPNNVWGLRADPAPVDAGRMGRVLLTLSVDHPVVSGHRLQGRNILPGLAYIDLVYQTFRMHGHRFAELELRDLAILRPLIVPKDRTISLAVECDPIEVGRWRVQVVERDAAERPYATAEMAASKAAPFSEELESTAMAEPSGTAKALERIYADYRQHGLAHSGFIQARGEVDERDDELIVDVAIGDHAHRSAEQFIFHPTLLDGSGVAAASLLRTMVEGQDRLFLPFHLASFRSTAALQQRCFARIRRASVRVKAELLYLTVEFFDASRRKVGELRDVAGKLVRPGALQAASERPAWTATMPAPPPVPTTGALEMLRRRVAAHIGGSAEAINVDVGFYELGLDSFKLVDLVNEIAADLATKLPPTLPFEHTTIRNLAIHLEQSFPNAFGRGNARPAVSVEAADTVSTAAQPESITSAVRSDTCEVAIIGMAGRYPGANDIESFFTNLKRGRNCITDVPGSRWHQEQVRGIHSATGRPISRWGGFVEDAECFDAEFFHISAREAEIMDPQERLFMQTCWEAIEDAGHTPATLCRPHGPDRRHRVGVFVGVMHKDYMLIGADAAADGTPLPLALNQGQIANRISFFCDFHGPSITVDTLCSSSLTAVHLAVESVRRGESEAAIAGGVNLSLHPGKYVTYGLANLHASDGLCRAFGEGGDGYVSAEGVGAIVLKPLASALRDGDNIYAVIRASAVGHGGKVAGISVPSPAGQADVIARSLADAAIEARTVGYVEAHGTGTALGDPIEIEGLARVYRRHTTETGFCAIGSVKTNIGHAEAAAGIAAITKTALQLHHKVLVPSLHSDPPNSRLSLAATPFRVQNTLEAWVHRAACDGAAVPRRAGVSSFGATGSNAHIILEEVLSDPVGQPAVAAAAAFVVPISARTEDQLESYVKKIRAILPPCLPDLAAQLRRMLADIVAVDEANLDSAAAWPRTVVESDHLTVLAERLSEETKLDVAAADLVRAGSLAATAQWLRDLRAKSAPSLAELAYTLQVGRVAHENRVAFIVRDAQELDHKIGVFLHSGGQAAGLYRGQASGNKDLVDLLQGEDGYRELLRGWFANGAIHKIAEAWVKGFDVDWALFYGARPPRRAHLPTYPFARRRYWIADNRETANRRPLAAAAGPAADATRNFRLLTKQWEPAAPVSSAPAAGAGDRPNISRTIVVLANAETAELAGALARRLPDSHQTVLLGVDAPGSRADPQWDRCDGWIDLIGCGAKADDASMAWLQSLQRFVEFGRRDAMRVLCVTRSLEAWQVPSVNLAGASRAGLYRTLQSEYRYLRSRHLDVDIALEDADALARLIASEFAIEADDPAICHRAGRRLRPYLQEEAFTPAPTRLAFPEDHVLWITGGTRGLGAACAQHFVQQYGVRRLVVTGREQFPPRGEWDERADEFPGLASKIAAICALEAAGARVQLLALPLSDRAAVTRSLQEVKETLGPIGGVIHAAGLADHDNPAFIRKSLATFGQVLEPKIAGLNVLYDSLRQEPLRFFLTFSSVSAAVPSLGAGQCDYATANAYMDFFAAAHAGECPIVSIEWPSWKETGMGPATGSAYYRTGLTSHGTADGLRLLDLILAGKFGPVVLPAVIDPMRWNPRALLGRSIAGDRPAARPRAANEAPSDQAPEALAVVRARLKELFAEELKVSPDRFEDDRPFQDYGVDSIILAQILQPVNRQAAEPIDPSVVYEHSTFNSLAAWFVRTPGALAGIQVAAEAKSTPAEPAPRPAARLRAPRRAAPLVSVPISGDVAVVGLSCRFPGAETLDDYWRLLAESRSAIQPVPRRRWGRAGNYYAALLEDIGSFDPDFFAIPDEDAKAMDPQALLLLEEALKLACHAGYEASELKGRPIGVYIGGRSQHRPGENEQRRARNLIRVVGQNYLATNISHFFDLHGPSLVVDTACSSGLVGMNLAIRALLAGEIEAAIVGAVSLLTSEAVHAGFEQRGILSPHSVFHLFDQRAHGIIPGEGCGMVLLKTVDRAVQDNDRIYAVIKALAVNNCGKTAGPAAPNFDAQKHLLQTALARSGRRSDDVGYVETNGSGSVVTDILELKTIEAVYRNESSTPCSLGSIKPNIGHPLSAEGIASFIKVVLMIQHRQRVPFLSGQQPLRHFDLAASPLFFDHARVPWTDEQRTAAINCFADGGTNAHAVVEAASGQAARTDARMPLPVPALCRRPVFQANGEMPAATAAEDLADEYRESPPLMVWEKYG